MSIILHLVLGPGACLQYGKGGRKKPKAKLERVSKPERPSSGKAGGGGGGFAGVSGALCLQI